MKANKEHFDCEEQCSLCELNMKDAVSTNDSLKDI